MTGKGREGERVYYQSCNSIRLIDSWARLKSIRRLTERAKASSETLVFADLLGVRGVARIKINRQGGAQAAGSRLLPFARVRWFCAWRRKQAGENADPRE